MLEKLRLNLIRFLIGRRAVIANVNIQFMEANTSDRQGAVWITCTRGTVAGNSGLIGIGTYALNDLGIVKHPTSVPIPLFLPLTPVEEHSLQPSAYMLRPAARPATNETMN